MQTAQVEQILLMSPHMLPSDAKRTDIISSMEFAKWFTLGTVATNGAVDPADSLNFRGTSNFSFYKWAQQMFLWLTSPAADARKTFESSAFYKVSEPAPDGKRSLVADAIKGLTMTTLGQSGGARVLMAQNGSLVYYTIQVNDVYAYFLTAEKTGHLTPPPTKFPTTQEELIKIADFALLQGEKVSYPNALVVAVKSAWVETTGLDTTNYVTTTATVPTFDTSNPTTWTPNGSKQAQLALVGMHIVGSAAGHPEMIWATFEHANNTPMAPYSYTNADGQIREVTASSDNGWLFSGRNSIGPFNIPNMHAKNAPTIEAFPGRLIEPSDTRRENPWGSSPNDPGRARKNTEVIAINRTIMDMLPDNDARKNYLLIGTTWSLGLGARRLANTTMETYQQDNNPFTCHHGNPVKGQLSFVYRSLRPLFS
jgi:hypothetical protein